MKAENENTKLRKQISKLSREMRIMQNQLSWVSGALEENLMKTKEIRLLTLDKFKELQSALTDKSVLCALFGLKESIDKLFSLSETQGLKLDTITSQLKSSPRETQKKVQKINGIQCPKSLNVFLLNICDKIKTFCSLIKRRLYKGNLADSGFKIFNRNPACTNDSSSASINDENIKILLPFSNEVGKSLPARIAGTVVQNDFVNIHTPKLKKTQKSARAKASKEAL